MRFDLRHQVGDLLFGGGKSIGTSDETARRLFLAKDIARLREEGLGIGRA